LPSEKNSAGDSTPALTRANWSIAGWLPAIAASRRCRSGGGGSSVASWVVSSYIGSTWASRADWYAAIASSYCSR
jgi:hypothetical protein